MENTEKKKEPVFVKIIGVIISTVFIAFLALDGYTYLMGRVHKVCGFDGAYIYEEEGTTVACIFDDNEMVMYSLDGINSSRISYTFQGYYYNKGLFNRFLDLNEKWLKIPDADKAGHFYANCETCVSTSAWGDFQYMDEEDIIAAGEENGINYSKTFYFIETGDLLTLISAADETSFSIPLTKVNVLTGDIGETIESLDMFWEYKFGE